jgi:signal peptide peptidase SppA
MLNLPHVASRVFGTPLMIARAKLEVILGVLAPRFSGAVAEPTNPEPDPAPPISITVERIAVVSVIGTLVGRSGYLDAASGLQSYGEIADAIAAAVDDATVRGVILDVDSPGGEVGGLFDLVEQISVIRSASSKPLWAVANESALSAAYAIASTADRVYVTRTGEVGSIGVVAVHVDESGADAKAGLAWTFVFAGERKVDGNAHEPLSERARATIQADVDRLYAEFCALVAANRGLPVETVRGTNAAIYRGELAIRVGLADQLGTLDLAIAEMATELDRAASPRALINPTPNRSPSMATNEAEQIQDQPREPQPPVETQPVPTDAAPDPKPTLSEPVSDANVADKLRAEFAEIAAIATQAARLGVTVDAAGAMRKGISADVLRRSVLDALAARAEATSVIAAAPSTPTAGDSPIVRRAKERAAASRA